MLTRGGLVPYVELPLADGDSPVRLSKVMVGPTLHPDLALNAARELLESKSIRCKVELTKTPYRWW